MKKFNLLLCLLLFNISQAQITFLVTNTIFDYLPVSATEHQFTFHTYFSFGQAGNCPVLINPAFVIDGNTLYIKGYYDIRRLWQDSYCQAFDTVTYNNQLPSNITHIITSTNVLDFGPDPNDLNSFTLYENVYTHDFDLTLSTAQQSKTKEIAISPNPTQGLITLDFGKKPEAVTVSVANTLGKEISRGVYAPAASLPIMIEGASGVYFVTVSSSRGIETFKVVKQ